MKYGAVYKKCNLCARGCGVDRTLGVHGFCGVGAELKVARASLHMWEEPLISGSNGSGTIFFSGCSLGCIYCQNRAISHAYAGEIITVERLADIMTELMNDGAHNINLVTPTHYAPSIKEAVEIAKAKGLNIPIVYNTGTYDRAETIKMLENTVDIYMPDMKYNRKNTGLEYSRCADYPDVAKAAIDEMVRQKGEPSLDENGLMRSGVIVRILLLPSHLAQAKLNLKYLYGKYGDSIYISLMNQYTPIGDLPAPLNRKVTHAEYEELIDYADRLGVKNAFYQDFGTAEESFIPEFNSYGVLPK